MFQDIGESTKVRRSPRYVEVRRHRNRLAGVENLGLEEFVKAPLDFVGNPVEKLRAIVNAQGAPRSFERSFCRPDCGVHIVARCFFDPCDNAAGRGVDIFS